MDHLGIYNAIVNRANSSNRSKKLGYFEKHHIIPKCVGGSNHKDNLVLLTAREHFICHRLLTHLYPDNNKLKFAFWAMCNQLTGDVIRKYKVTSGLYSKAKLNFATVNSKRHKGKKISQHQIDTARRYMLSDRNPRRGKVGKLSPLFEIPRSEDTKNKIKETKLKHPENNGQYKGNYVTPLGIFSSSYQAANAHSLHSTTVIKRCKENQVPLTPKAFNSLKDISPDNVGKTFKELGWDFIPK